jgi:heme/copper-type cytochrome/quinol oxidase subunit 3
MHHYTTNRHIGYEAAAWYWHFVDVVWIFLFLTVYFWGG